MQTGKVVLEAGADVNAKDADHWSILLHVCFRVTDIEDGIEIVQVLLERVEPIAMSAARDGITPQYLEVSSPRFKELLPFLLRNGVDSNCWGPEQSEIDLHQLLVSHGVAATLWNCSSAPV